MVVMVQVVSLENLPFVAQVLPRKILHLTHFDITNLTNEFPLITQKPFDLTSFKAELHRAWCRTWWKWSMMRLVIIYLVGKMIGCITLNGSSTSWMHPPTLRMPFLLRNGDNSSKRLLFFIFLRFTVLRSSRSASFLGMLPGELTSRLCIQKSEDLPLLLAFVDTRQAL